jgi:hypothetical protein
MLVEQYFGSLLPTTQYWHGASRAALGSDYTLTDGMPIMQARMSSFGTILRLPAWRSDSSGRWIIKDSGWLELLEPYRACHACSCLATIPGPTGARGTTTPR